MANLHAKISHSLTPKEAENLIATHLEVDAENGTIAVKPGWPKGRKFYHATVSLTGSSASQQKLFDEVRSTGSVKVADTITLTPHVAKKKKPKKAAGASSNPAAAAVPPPPPPPQLIIDQDIKWQYQQDDKVFADYDDEISLQLETQYQTNPQSSTVKICIHDQEYYVNMSSKKQINLTTGTTRDIRRGRLSEIALRDKLDEKTKEINKLKKEIKKVKKVSTAKRTSAPVWQFDGDTGLANYDSATSAALEAAYSASEPNLKISHGKFSYVVDFASMQQTNEQTKKVRRVQRQAGTAAAAPVWQFDGDTGLANYDSATSAALEAAYSASKPNLKISHGKFSYVVDFASMQQTNEQTKKVRRVQRQAGTAAAAAAAPVWQFDGDAGLANYDSATSAALEAAYSASKPNLKISHGKFSYVVDFASMQQTNEKTKKVRQVQRQLIHANPHETSAAAAIADEDVQWLTTTPVMRFSSNIEQRIIDASKLDVTLVHQEQHHWNAAVTQFTNLMHGTASQVGRLEVWSNPVVTARYRNYKKSNPHQGGKEHWVFHGTPFNNVNDIMKGGFKVGGQGVAVAHGSAHGQGVYTATGPSTPLGYSTTAGNGFSRVLILSKGYCGPPSDHARAHSDWIIFRNADQVLPMYVLYLK